MFMSLNILILSTFIVTFATAIITEYRNTNLDCYISYIHRDRKKTAPLNKML